jgi:hypothetical protein
MKRKPLEIRHNRINYFLARSDQKENNFNGRLRLCPYFICIVCIMSENWWSKPVVLNLFLLMAHF